MPLPPTKITILAVDDNQAHNYALARILESAGYLVLPAYTGSQALQLLQQRPDAVLLDINLPDMDGFEVCRRVRNDVATRHVPVVLFTSGAPDANATAMAERAGARALLFYPIEPTQLLAVLRGHLAGSP